MIAATYHPSTNVHAIAQIIALIAIVVALCMVPVLATAVMSHVYICLCCVAKTVAVAALAASPLLIIWIQKGSRC